MPRTVLLADDSVTAQNMGRRILTDAGYEVITVNNGSAALKKIHESRPDLIVLDVYMPGYGGLEICQRLKESEATMKIPVLLTVGKMEPFKTDEAKRVRADGHIIKPFDASELLAALTKLEDRIIPKENGKARGKAESKKSKSSSGREPVAEGEDSRTDQISYLKQRKERQATAPKQVSAEESRVPETAEDAVTFASGPIFDPKAWTAAEKTAPEFPVEKETDVPLPTASPEASAAPIEEQTSATAETTSNAAAEDAAPAPAVQSASAEVEPPSGPRWVAENVELSAEEASRSLDEEMRYARTAEEERPASEPVTSEPVVPETAAEEHEQPAVAPSAAASEEAGTAEKEVEPAREPESTSGAAFAAAASASSSSVSTDAIGNSAPSTESEPKSEAATAWNDWERIRDSVVNQQTTEALAQSAAAMIQASSEQSEPAAAPEETGSAKSATAEASSSQQPAPGGDALSSIVDTVLAELKPRLLAEIAKQIAADKK